MPSDTASAERLSVSVTETPAQRRRREVRDAIIVAAERVFANEGASGLSIRRLASEIDYSPGAIYKYFDSKEELLEELKGAFFERLIEKMDETLAMELPYPQTIRRCFGTYIRTALERPHHYAAAFSEARDLECEDGSEEDREAFENSTSGLAYTRLSALVEVGRASGFLRSELNVDLAAKSMWASMHGLVLLMIHLPTFPNAFPGNTPLNSDQFIDYHADVTVRGLEA